MDKKSFINRVNFEDKVILSSIYDKILLCEKTNKVVFTKEFYPPNLWKQLLNLQKLFNINFYVDGVFEEAERKTLAFSSYDLEEFPLNLIKITNKSNFKKLEHKDYLGAIMSLGIKREKFGDLILKEDGCYIPAFNDICSYIQSNLFTVGNNPCEIEVLQEVSEFNIKADFLDLTIITTSLRIDSVVSSLTNMSRSKAVDFINQGKVLVDYLEVREKDSIIEKDCIITLRGFGKYKIGEVIGTTSSGRSRLSIKKYI